MPIIFSALAPHPPILIPAIGKDNAALLKNTSASYVELEQDLYVAQVETIIIISPHGLGQARAFTINLNQQFKGDFKEFGDLATNINLDGDVALANRIKEKLETQVPLQLTSEVKLDHGTAIPLYLLTPHLPKIKIIPIYHSDLDLKAHFEFGQLIKNQLADLPARVAIIASGDLSHRLSKNAPAGYTPKGKKFDKKVIDGLLAKNTDEIINLDPELAAEAGECALKSITILLGTLDGIKYEPKLLSYEAPFGVGYAVMKFKL